MRWTSGWRGVTGDVALAVILTVLVAVIWRMWTPLLSDATSGPTSVVGGLPITQDAHFAVLAIAAGVIAGAWIVGPPTPTPLRRLLVALLAGAGGSLAAWQLGVALAGGRSVPGFAPGQSLRVLDIHLPGVLLLWPATVAVVVFGWSVLSALRRDPEPGPTLHEASSGVPGHG